MTANLDRTECGGPPKAQNHLYAERIRRTGARAAVLAAILWLGACATQGPPPAPAAPSSPPAGAGGPVGIVYDPANPAFRASDVIGRTAPAIDKLFGAPALVRTEGVGELRRYDLAACSLIVLMLDAGQGALAAAELYASRRSSDAPEIDAARCLGVGRGPGA
ncbi:MAG: hypothetical protein GC152_02035 [Alphaproteobacteria bacterium]|nr:hypothetical protein [Alphaproteobacteria bacterium]